MAGKCKVFRIFERMLVAVRTRRNRVSSATGPSPKAGNGGWELALPRSQTRPHLLFSADNGSVSQASITRAVSLRGTGDICDMDDDVRMERSPSRGEFMSRTQLVSDVFVHVRSVVTLYVNTITPVDHVSNDRSLDAFGKTFERMWAD